MFFSSLPYAGGSQDGSQLATIESLVDHHTLAIDDSIFTRPVADDPQLVALYSPGEAPPQGIIDKIYVDGHYYSHKGPVLSLLGAGVYQVLQWTTGLEARQRPGAFIYAMNMASSGLAFVVLISGAIRVARLVGLPPRIFALLVGSLALATLAPVYSRQLNAHIILVSIAQWLLWALLVSLRPTGTIRFPNRGLLLAGCLAGLAYTADQGVGPALLLGSSASVLLCKRFRVRPLVAFGLGALPWVILNHGLNYAIGKTLLPLGTVGEYFQWPGSPWTEAQLTGAGAGHESPMALLRYAFSLLFGSRGFLRYNLPLWLAIPGLLALVRQSIPERGVVLPAVAWVLGSWLIYSVSSNNFSGCCVSIRWFVPFLAPGFLILGLLLRQSPRLAVDLALLSGFGIVVTWYEWWWGPFHLGWMPLRRAFLAVALVSWVLLHAIRTWRPMPLLTRPLDRLERFFGHDAAGPLGSGTFRTSD